jgi:hypothetical protein
MLGTYRSYSKSRCRRASTKPRRRLSLKPRRVQKKSVVKRERLRVAREPHTAEKKQVLQQPAGKPAVALAVGAIGPGRGDW